MFRIAGGIAIIPYIFILNTNANSSVLQGYSKLFQKPKKNNWFLRISVKSCKI